MKKITLLIIASFLFFGVTNAQIFQIGVNTNSPLVFGDISKKEINNPSAGYVISASGGSFEFMFHLKNGLGFGFKTHYNVYTKDINQYKVDLAENLGVADSNFIMQSIYIYNSIGGQIGISYDMPIKGKFHIEPYFYFGFNVFTSPVEEANYFKNGKVYTRKKPLAAFFGMNYTPGVKFQWNFFNEHLGINVFAEYDGISMSDWEEEYVTFSNNSFEKTYETKSYNISSINLGAGVAYRFGTGLNK